MDQNIQNLVDKSLNQSEDDVNTWKFRASTFANELSSLDKQNEELKKQLFLHQCFVSEMGLKNEIQQFREDLWPENFEELWKDKYKNFQKNKPDDLTVHYEELYKSYQGLFMVCDNMISFWGLSTLIRILNDLTLAYIQQEKEDRDLSTKDGVVDLIYDTSNGIVLTSYIANIADKVLEIERGLTILKSKSDET